MTFFTCAANAAGMISRTVVFAALVIAAAAASADPLPFVQSDGIGTASVRYADVIRALGVPGHSEAVSRSSQRQFSYPDRGLSFVTDGSYHSQNNPDIISMRVSAPADETTPHGLYIGMPAAEALAVLDHHYRIERRYHLGAGGELSSVDAMSRQGPATRKLDAAFHRGELSR